MGTWEWATTGTGRGYWYCKGGNCDPSKKPSGPPSTNNGGGTNYGGGTKGTAQEAPTDAEIEAVKKMWNDLFDNGDPTNKKGKNYNIPKDVLSLALKEGWNSDRLLKWVRQNDKDLYTQTIVYGKRLDEFKHAFTDAFGNEFSNYLEALAPKYAMKDPGNENAADVEDFFNKFLMNKNSAFYKEFFGNSWEVFRKSALFGTGSLFSAIGEFRKQRAILEATYKNLVGKDAVLTDELFSMYLENPTGGMDAFTRWVITNDPRWLQTHGGTYTDENGNPVTPDFDPNTDLGHSFDDYYAGIFGEVDTSSASYQALRNEYIKFANIQGIGKDTQPTNMNDVDLLNWFFEENIVNSEEFKKKFPGYEEWRKKQGPNYVINGEGFGGFFKDREALITAYQQLMGYDVVINEEFLNKAIANNWDSYTFQDFLRHNDPQWSNSAEAQQKVASFNAYYQSIFGAGRTSSLAYEFAASDLTDPSDMFNAIRNTAEFKAEYGSWDAYAAAQAARGNTSAIINNPALYKRYRETIRDAFTNYGLVAPDDAMIFKSGVDENEVTGNIRSYVESAISYQWQSGEKADLMTAAGLNDRKAGGDLRVRFAKAVAKHRTFTSSEFVAGQTGEQKGTNLITQRI